MKIANISILINFMKVLLRIIKNQAKEFYCSLMVMIILVLFKMIRRMGLEFIITLMAASMKGNI
jgi:hypothetical protein